MWTWFENLILNQLNRPSGIGRGNDANDSTNRLTIQVVTNLPLTPKTNVAFKYSYKLLILKRNFCFDVNWRFVTT